MELDQLLQLIELLLLQLLQLLWQRLLLWQQLRRSLRLALLLMRGPVGGA